MKISKKKGLIKMNKSKKFICISIVSLLLSLVLNPVINAEKNDDVPSLEIGYTNESGNSFYTVIKLTDEQIQKFRFIWIEWEDYLKKIREDIEIDSEEIKELEIKSINLLETIKNLTRNPDTGEVRFPSDIIIPAFVHSHFFLMGFGARIFSIGRGRAWIPFNRQGEAFIGVRFNPIFLSYSIGFTRVSVRSLSIFYSGILNRFFMHRVCTAGFIGLFINFANLFLDTSAGPVILIGKPLFITVGSDIF